jgi:predicted Zn-dependent peptidase
MIHFEKFKLSNGLNVIVHEDNSTPIACINILYHVGARDENPEHTGFAHLFEHLMFGGSLNIPNYDQPLQMAGGENNAFTNNDFTNYYLTLPAENLETGFWLESDRMLSLAFSEKSLEVQRNVVMEEFKQRYLNQPYGDIWLLLKPLAYKHHPYRWNTIGMELSHIENAHMQQVKDFFSTWYHPSNATLVVAGPVKTDEIKNLSEKWFGTIPAKQQPIRNLPKEPAQTEARSLTVERNVPSSALYIAFPMCERMHEDYHSYDLLSDIMGNGASSRLYQSLVKEQKLFIEAGAFVSGDHDPGLWVFSGKLSQGVSMETAEKAVWKELQNMAENGPGDDELTRVQNKVESLYAFGNMNVLNKAMNLAIFEWLGDASMVNDETAKYRDVNAKKIHRIAAKTFLPEYSNTLRYLSASNA